VLAGVVLLAGLQNALRLQDVSNEALNIVTGVLLIVSVLLPNIVSSARAALRRRRRRSPSPDPGALAGIEQ
jgi:rhamnose transport system permease protein